MSYKPIGNFNLFHSNCNNNFFQFLIFIFFLFIPNKCRQSFFTASFIIYVSTFLHTLIFFFRFANLNLFLSFPPFCETFSLLFFGTAHFFRFNFTVAQFRPHPVSSLLTKISERNEISIFFNFNLTAEVKHFPAETDQVQSEKPKTENTYLGLVELPQKFWQSFKLVEKHSNLKLQKFILSSKHSASINACKYKQINITHSIKLKALIDQC